MRTLAPLQPEPPLQSEPHCSPQRWRSLAAGPTEGGKQEELRATATMDKIRRMVLRARPSRAEVSLLRGSLQTIRTPKAKATAPAATPASGRHDAGAESGVDSNST